MVLIRFVVVSAIALIFLRIIVTVLEKQNDVEPIFANIYIITIVSFNILAELQIVIDNVMERFFPVPRKLRLRIAIQLLVSILFLLVTHQALLHVVGPDLMDNSSRPGVVMGVLSGLIFVQMIAYFLLSARFTRKWLDSQDEIAEMKREKLQMDYRSLQDQLNPHFLFNNLSVLKSLIIYDQDAAVDFTENFTDVYRYVLQSKEKRLVKLSEEIEFIRAYFALHKERIGDGIKVTTKIDEKQFDREIAPLTGQLLLENAIKHNIASRETPLLINIEINKDYLIVANKLNLRTAAHSTKTGLKNLVQRYEMLTSKEVIIRNDEGYFEVKVPLL